MPSYRRSPHVCRYLLKKRMRPVIVGCRVAQNVRYRTPAILKGRGADKKCGSEADTALPVAARQRGASVASRGKAGGELGPRPPWSLGKWGPRRPARSRCCAKRKCQAAEKLTKRAAARKDKTEGRRNRAAARTRRNNDDESRESRDGQAAVDA